MKKSEIPVLLIHAGLSQCEKIVNFLRDHCFCRVDTATDAEKALDLAASSVNSYHLALVDAGSPAGEGERPGRMAIDLIRKIKSESPHTEIIAFLAASPADIDEALHAGVFRYLTEPINFAELAIVMRQALEYRELKMQAQENQALEQLMQASAALLGGQSEEAVLDCSLKAVGILAFDRARLYLLSDDKEFLVCKAQSGMPDDYVGQKWPVAHSKSLQVLLREQRAIVFKHASDGPLPPEEMLNDDVAGECGFVPLLSRGEMIGQLSVDNKVTRRPILERNLRTLATFASHAAAAIENARLLADVERRAHNLSAVLKTLSSIGSSLDLGAALKAACRAAVELLGVDHSGLVLFAPDLKTGRVSAEYPEHLGARSLEIPLWRVPSEEQLIHSREPVIIRDVANDASLGPVRDILAGLGISSILIVPIVIKGDVVGSFSLDSVNRKRVFTNEDVELCKVFAAQVAVAINNAQLFRRAKQEVRKLNALRHTTLAINSTLSRTTLLRNIIRSAVRLLKAKSGGLYQYFPEHRKLVVIADYNRPGHLNKVLSLGDGMAGKLIERNEPFMIIPDYAKWEGRTRIYDDTQPFGAVVSVPLKWKKQVTGVLYVDDAVGREFAADDARLLRLFADQAALALSNAQLVARDEEKLKRLEKLSQATTEMMRATTLDDRLKLIVRHTAEILEAGVCGAYLFKDDGCPRFEAFYGPGEHLPDPSGVILAGPFPGGRGKAALGRELFGYRGGPADPDAGVEANKDFVSSNEDHSALAVDLKHKKEGEEERLVGRLYVSNKKNENDSGLPAAGFSREDAWILNILADAVVVAIENAELVQEVSRRNAHLELLLGVSNALSQAGDLAGGLQRLAEMLVSLLSHSFCRILLIGEDAASLKPTAAYYSPRQCGGIASGSGTWESILISEWPGLYELLRRGEPELLGHHEQASSESLIRLTERLGLESPIQSLLIVPLKIEGRLVGMFDLGEVSDKGRNPFAGEEIELVKAIAAQTTALIDRMRRNAERESLHKAAQAMSRFFELGDVLQSIVTSVKDALGADSVAVLPYDEGIGRFIPEELAAANIPDDELMLFREEEPEPGRTARTVMQKGWVGVSDIRGAEFDFIGMRTREMLSRIKARSFQGIVLRVGSEAVGVLYVNYRYPRNLGGEDRHCLDNLAKYAALSLKKARLLDHVKKTERAAQIVAKVMALGDLDITMFSIVNGTKEAIDCDAVVLYTFDPISNSFNSPVTTGVDYPNRVSGYRDVPNSLVYRMLRLAEPYKAEKVSTDPLFKGRRFALDEKIKSCLAIPLKAVGHEVGVMFVNYHRQHRFTADELTSIELFANQAAAAIRNAHLFQERTRKLLEQGKLGELSKGLLSIKGSHDVLDLAASTVRDLVGPDGCEIILREKNKGRFFTARLVTRGESIDPQGAGRDEASRTDPGFTFKESSCPAGNDWPVPDTPSWNGLQYGVSVPMEIAGELIGIMSLYTAECRPYTDAEVTLLSIIANQASIAIRTADQYEAIKRQSASLDALYRAGKAITASFGSGRKQVLDRIVEQAAECLKVGKGLAIAFGTIQLYNDETDELHFESACSREYTEVFARLGEVRFVKGMKGGHKTGIAGRTVLTREPQLVGDVTKDQDYVEFDPRMKSALCVPLLDQGRVRGVLGLESDKENAFDRADVSTLEALAELAVIAIRNAQQYDDLKSTRVLAESRTALAWMGMTSSTWRHMIHGHAITIKDLVELAVSDLNKKSLGEVREKLLDISDLAVLIQQHPITAPLSSEEGVRSILVNALLQERMGQLWEQGAYKSVELRFDFRLPSAATVRANPDWLNRALGVLVDNAIDAMKAPGEKVLSVSSRAVGRVAQIEIKDTGNGIPPHILGRVLQKPTEHPKGTKKLGLGLLMARLIIQVYGGDIRCEETGPSGTTMALSLPLEA